MEVIALIVASVMMAAGGLILAMSGSFLVGEGEPTRKNTAGGAILVGLILLVAALILMFIAGGAA